MLHIPKFKSPILSSRGAWQELAWIRYFGLPDGEMSRRAGISKDVFRVAWDQLIVVSIYLPYIFIKSTKISYPFTYWKKCRALRRGGPLSFQSCMLLFVRIRRQTKLVSLIIIWPQRRHPNRRSSAHFWLPFPHSGVPHIIKNIFLNTFRSKNFKQYIHSISIFVHTQCSFPVSPTLCTYARTLGPLLDRFTVIICFCNFAWI